MSVSDGLAVRPLARGYTREPCVLQEIAALSRLAPPERLRRLESRSEGPAAETLVYWARHFHLAGDDDSAWRALTVLAERISRTVAGWLSRAYGLTRDDHEELMDALIHALYGEWLSGEEACAFWEVHFAFCLKRKLITAIKRHRRERETEVHLVDPNADGEDASDPLDQLPDTGATDPAESAMLACALDTLPPPLREAYYLHHHEQWTEDRIGDYLGCTGRTVRNYLRRAKGLLAPWRDSELTG